MGVNLYNNNHTIQITGKKSLEYSLNKLYGNGGYLYTFDAKDFKFVTGLGTSEVITTEPLKYKKREFIKDIVKEMKKIGVKFIFVDETKESN